MSFCFQIPSGDMFFLYASDSDLLLQAANSRGFQYQSHVANDYVSSLSAVYLEGMIYYSYIDKDGMLTLHSLAQKQPLLQKKASAETVFPPRLLAFQQELLLLSVEIDNIQNSDAAVQKLCITLPLKQGKEYFLPEIITESSVLLLFDVPTNLWFLLLSDSQPVLYCFDQAFTFRKYAAASEHALERLSEENETLRLQLGSAKAQYDQLMDVAIQYREEAKKWYERCIRR